MNRFFYPDESATAQLLADLAFGLVAESFDVHIICSRQLYDAPAAGLAAEECIRGVFVHRVATTYFGRRGLAGRALDYFSFYASCLVALMVRLAAGDIVVAKTDPPLISIVVATVAKLKGAVLINWLQDLFPEIASELGVNPLSAPLSRLLCRMRDGSLRAAVANVVLGSRMRDYLLLRGLPDRNIVIENWPINAAVPAKSAGDSGLRRQLGLLDHFVIGYAGNLGRAHDYQTLLDAAELLLDDPQIAFLMIGGGVGMDAFRSAAVTRHLRNVHFLPYQPRGCLDDSLAAADVHVACLRPALEGFIVPSKFYGILAAGRPVIFIGDRDGELARIIAANQCGATVGIGDCAALVRIIRYLQAHAAVRDAMAAASRRLLVQKYSASRAKAEWVGLLRRVRPPLTVRGSPWP